MRIKLLVLLPFFIGQQYLFAQFSSAKLQATGLTCALCSNAINKSLEELPFVKSVEPILKESAFVINFKSGTSFRPDVISSAVEDAGFFVGELVLTGEFASVPVNENGFFDWGGNYYHLLGTSVRQLDGKVNLKLLDKKFLTEKAFKKISSQVHENCAAPGQRTYHVQLVK
jgi:copper chaperone CopZ